MATIIRNNGGGGVSTFELAINIPYGVTSVTVTRTVSGLGETELLGTVTASDPIYKGDVLVTSGVGATDIGYSDPTGITYEVTGNTIATVEVGSYIEYTLTISVPKGVSAVTVERTASPFGGSIGEITEDDPIYYGDVLVTSATASDLYYDPTGLTYTVSGNTTATVTAGAYILPDVSFANATWAEVKEIADAIRDGSLTVQTASSGYKYVELSTDTWTVGDTKTLTLTGNDAGIYTIRICDFQHWNDENSANATAINMEFVGLLNNYYIMNSSRTNSGGWDSTILYTTLNTTIKEQFPTDVTDNMVQVTCKSTIGAQSTSIESIRNYLTLPSWIEIGETTTEGYASEGSRLNYYSVNTSASYRVKATIYADQSYWYRSPFVSTSIHYLMVITAGTFGGQYADAANYVAPLFSF